MRSLPLPTLNGLVWTLLVVVASAGWFATATGLARRWALHDAAPGIGLIAAGIVAATLWRWARAARGRCSARCSPPPAGAGPGAARCRAAGCSPTAPNTTVTSAPGCETSSPTRRAGVPVATPARVRAPPAWRAAARPGNTEHHEIEAQHGEDGRNARTEKTPE